MATIPTREQDRLPDSEFAYVAPGGKKDSTGKTMPRSKRHLPIKDAAHVKAAEARFNQTRFDSAEAKKAAWGKIVRAAGKFGVKLTKTLGANGQLVDKGAAKNARRADDGVHVATLSVVVEGHAPEWIELIPGPEFSGRDGRGPFTMRDPQAVIRATENLKMNAGIPVDYDHGTDFGAPRGVPAPAAGWIKVNKLEVRNGALWGRVEWTEKAAAVIEAKEYRYISPVFTYDKPAAAGKDEERGEVRCLLRAALTNNPNLELKAIASRSVTMAKKSKLDALVEAIQEAAEEIGMPVDSLLEGISHKLGGDLEDPDNGGSGDGDDAGDDAAPSDGSETEDMVRHRHAEAAAQREEDGYVEAPAEQTAREAREKQEIDESRGRRGGAHARRQRPQNSGRGDRKAVARMVASHPTVVTMARELNELQAERAREKAEAAVHAAIRARKVTPALREWAINYATEDPRGFAIFVGAQPAIVDDEAFNGQPPRGGREAAGLSQAELTICSQFKIDPKKFAEHRAVMASERHVLRTLPERS